MIGYFTMCKYAAPSGNTMVEYSIALGLVAVIGIYGLKALGPAISGNLDKAATTKGTLSLLNGPSGESGGGSNANSGGGATQASNNGGANGSAASNTASAPDVTNGGSNAAIQVSGSNGDSGKVYGISQSIRQLAAKYQNTDPAAYNMIIKLGLQGETVAQSMVDLAKSNQQQSNAISTVGGGSAVANASANATSNSQDYNAQSENYRNLWGMEVRTSSTFSSLSPEDQATLTNLAEESNVIMQNYQTTTTNVQPATTVQNDGVATIKCGSGKC